MINDEDFKELLNKYYYNYNTGDLIAGIVVGIEKDYINIDIGSKTNAICTSYEILNPEKLPLNQIFNLNQEYEFIINSKENEEGVFYLSHKKVALRKNIETLKEILKNNETIQGTITNITKGGVLVNVMGIRGFVPSSQIKTIDENIGQTIDLKVLSIDTDTNNYIFSNKKVYEDTSLEIKKDIIEKIELNMVLKGTVVRLTDFGAFIDIGGLDGLLPLSQISWNWIDNPADILKCGEKIDVEVIGIDKEKQRVSLSLKTLTPNPWPEAKEFFESKKEIAGKITSIKNFGAFVEVYPKVEGLLTKRQLQEYSNKYNKSLNINDEVIVGIKNLDIENQKITLEII